MLLWFACCGVCALDCVVGLCRAGRLDDLRKAIEAEPRLVDKAHQESKIVMISAHGSLLEQIKEQEQSFDYFMAKPFSRDNISKILLELDI